jgi:Transposase IS66 family
LLESLTAALNLPCFAWVPTEAVVAYVLVAKYAWHLPLNWQAQMLLAQCLDIKRAILAFWVGDMRPPSSSRSTFGLRELK